MSRKSITTGEKLIEEPCCKPLDTYEEILAFLEDPPAWRSLCKELTPHSKEKIRNISLNSLVGEISLERPPTFCHFSPDQEDVEREPASSLPKTLVCHDMANGYHEDSMIDGSSDHTAYSFYHWGGIDIFCYFSHHLITIPPVGWINTGHAHGVKVIGTVITEWTEGIDFWDFVLEERERYEGLASALVTIARTLRFEGWLLNVENKVSKPQVLLEFVRVLHRRLHEEVADAVLIWYDSVTIKGNLNWQNGLNDSNKDFFEACDGFFTNYSWKEADVVSSVEAAGARVADLFVGIDVWGRNFYGGGQFNTAAAVELASSYGCSLAVFAPAWTHEGAQRRDADAALAAELDAPALRRLRDRALWGSLWPYLCTGLPCALPFQTSFCRGHGTKRRLYGEVMSPGPWYNLRHMQYQPNSAYGPHGYLLSTPEHIAQVSHHGVRDKNKGIMKYTSAFEESRHELHRVRSVRELHELQHEQCASSTHDSHDTHDAHDTRDMHDAHDAHDTHDKHVTLDAHAADDDEEDDEGSHGMKNAIKNMFRYKMKSKRRSPAAAAEAAEAQSQHSLRQGWSMRRLSLSLHLGQHTGRRLALACVQGEQQCLEPYFDDSYTGGSCLRVHPSDALSPEHRLTRLFHCDFPCESELIVCVVTKTLPGHANQYLDVKLFARDVSGQELRVWCVGHAVPGGARGGVAEAAPRLHAQHALTLYPLLPGPAFSDLQKYLLLQQPGFYQSVENSFGWKIRYYVAPLGSVRVTSINVHCGHNEGPILLGHIGVCHRYEETEEVYNFDDDVKVRSARDTQQPGQCMVSAAKQLAASATPPERPASPAGHTAPPPGELADTGHTRTVHTDLPSIRRDSTKVEYERIPKESAEDPDEHSFQGAFALNFVENVVGLSPLGSFDSEETHTTLTGSEVSLCRTASSVDSRASEISDISGISKSTWISTPELSERPKSPRYSNTLENSDIPKSQRHSRTLEHTDRGRSARGRASHSSRAADGAAPQPAAARRRHRRVHIAIDD